MDEQTSLTENDQVAVPERKAPVVAPAHKAIKKKSSITKLVLIGVAIVIGMIFALVPMRFGLTLYHPF